MQKRLERIAQKKGHDLSEVVSDLLTKDVELLEELIGLIGRQPLRKIARTISVAPDSVRSFHISTDWRQLVRLPFVDTSPSAAERILVGNLWLPIRGESMKMNT